MNCARCPQKNPPQARFCLGCGGRLAAACTRCGVDLAGGARFCSQCGHEVGARPTVDSRFPAPGAYTPKHLIEKSLTSIARSSELGLGGVPARHRHSQHDRHDLYLGGKNHPL